MTGKHADFSCSLGGNKAFSIEVTAEYGAEYRFFVNFEDVYSKIVGRIGRKKLTLKLSGGFIGNGEPPLCTRLLQFIFCVSAF